MLLSLMLLALAQDAPTGRLIVLSKAEDRAQIFDLPSGAVRATLATGAGPHEVAVTPDRKWAVVANYGREQAGSSLSLIDLEQLENGPVLDLGAPIRPHGLAFAPDGRQLFVTAETAGQLWLLSFPEGRPAAKLPTRAKASHMVALHGDWAYTANIASGSITPIDWRRQETRDPIPTGGGAEGIAVAPDGRVWVSNRAADTVTVVDPAQGKVAHTFDCPGFPIRVVFSHDGALALVSCPNAGDVALFDAAKPSALARIPIAAAAADDGSGRLFGDQFGASPVPIGMAVAPGHAYVACAGADRVAVIDLTRREVVNFLVTAKEPDGIAWVPAS